MTGNDNSYPDMSLRDFLSKLASKQPVPGGGGASALVGALAAALGCMVANLTTGKKKYAAVEVEVCASLDKLTKYQAALTDLINKDANIFTPLAEAYRIPETNPDKPLIMDTALRKASGPPAEMISYACRILDELEKLVINGSRMAISDVGVAAACCVAAINGAYLNVLINRRALSQTYPEFEEEIYNKVTTLRKAYNIKAEAVFNATVEYLEK
jgi:formiminotetrahydrofolate cyclodeaminase